MHILTRNRFIWLLATALLLWLVVGLLRQPSPADFQTRFTEVLRYRNPNNTGPVLHVRLVTASDTNWQELLAYGGLQPHSKYGTTTVYFFAEGAPLPPALNPREPHFESPYGPGCLARYQKLGQGQERFERWPWGR